MDQYGVMMSNGLSNRSQTISVFINYWFWLFMILDFAC